MTTPNHQPLSSEEHLRHVCAGVLKFLDKQIAEMEALFVMGREHDIMQNMVDEFSQVAYALRLALEPQVEIKTAFQKSEEQA